jgi:uncharacterized protein (TIGR03083 family)
VPTIVDKDRSVRLLREEFEAVTQLCRDFSAADWATPTCLPGWTVKDQLSHMAGTEHMLAGDPAPTVVPPEAAHLKNDIGKSNEIWVEANRALPGHDVLSAFADVAQRRLQALDAMSQADFDEPSWTPAGPNETFGRFMRIRHFDCFTHEHDIRAALNRPGRDAPDHLQSCLDEVATAIGYIVGRKARLPQGTTVTIELTGPLEATYHVVVTERAAVVPALEGAPTTTIAMPVLLWLRLTAGRTSDLTGVEIDGDQDLGGQLANNLAFTI